MHKRDRIATDGGWWYVELVGPVVGKRAGLLRYRRWHPGYWWYVTQACWQAWRRSVPHG